MFSYFRIVQNQVSHFSQLDCGTICCSGEQTGVFRSKRSRCIYLPAVSGETLDHKEIPPSQMGMSHLQFEDGDCGPRTGFSVEESSSGFMEDDETDSSESGSESDDDSSETELDVDEEMAPVSG